MTRLGFLPSGPFYMLHFRRGTVGARHAPMRQLPTFERQNSTKKPPGQRKSPLLLTEGGTAQAVTGVEGTRCNLRTAWKDDRRATSPFRGGIRTAGFGVWNSSGRGMPPPLHAKSIVHPAPHPVRLEPDHLVMV